VGLAVKWVREVIGGYGGDPRHVYLMGHSAGAVHVASYVAFPEFQRVGGTGLAGAILVSGLYAFDRMKPGKPELTYFGDKAGSGEVSSLPGLLAAPVPLLVAHAGLDPQNFIDQAKLLSEALCARGNCPRFVELAPHSHMSEVYAINTSDRSLWEPLVEFMKTGR
jgi:triacylglycerol lipase